MNKNAITQMQSALGSTQLSLGYKIIERYLQELNQELSNREIWK